MDCTTAQENNEGIPLSTHKQHKQTTCMWTDKHHKNGRSH